MISTIIGSIIKAEDFSVLYTANDEDFYKVHIQTGTCNIPAVCSEFFLGDIEGRVKMEGYITNTFLYENGNRKLFTYFRIVNVIPVGDDVADDSEIVEDVTITKVGYFNINKSNGRAYLPFVGRCLINSKRSAVVHFLAVEGTARLLRGCEVGDNLKLKGKLHNGGEPIKVVITHVDEIIRKEEQNGEV